MYQYKVNSFVDDYNKKLYFDLSMGSEWNLISVQFYNLVYILS